MSAGGAIGRYFSVAVLIPATVLVTYLAALIGTGALTGNFRPSELPTVVMAWGLSGLGWLVAASVVTGLCLHPLTYSFTQVLEGYWGVGRLRLLLTEHHVRRHRRRIFRLHDMLRTAEEAWIGPVEIPETATPDEKSRLHGQAVELAKARLSRPQGDPLLRPFLEREAARIELDAYPTQANRVLPTRLGNALRRMEDSAGVQYGLDAITVAPHLAMTADPGHHASVSGARESLDLLVNLCVVGMSGCVISLVLLADDGLSVAFALAPFSLAWVAYRGAVGAAQEFGATVAAMIDLSRFGLYDALRLPQPESTAAEAERGPLIVALLSGKSVDLPLNPTSGEPQQENSPAC